MPEILRAFGVGNGPANRLATVGRSGPKSAPPDRITTRRRFMAALPSSSRSSIARHSTASLARPTCITRPRRCRCWEPTKRRLGYRVTVSEPISSARKTEASSKCAAGGRNKASKNCHRLINTRHRAVSSYLTLFHFLLHLFSLLMTTTVLSFRIGGRSNKACSFRSANSGHSGHAVRFSIRPT